MDIELQNAIRLFFPNPSFTQIYFEAIANAFDAGANEIKILISIHSFSEPQTLSLVIADNGNGFTDESYERFSRLLKPQDRYHKGLGRLIYLQYFSKVNIKSTYGKTLRAFVFDKDFDGKNPGIISSLKTAGKSTSLEFEGFIGEKVKSYEDLKPQSIKAEIVSQFLPWFCERKEKNNGFKIEIELDAETPNSAYGFSSCTEVITLQDIPSLSEEILTNHGVDLYDSIKIKYLISQDWKGNSIFTAACIDGRTIQVELIPPTSIPQSYSAIFLFYSDYFKGRADSSRQKIKLPDEISERTLFSALKKRIASILAISIPQIEQNNRKIEKTFEEKYPHLLGYFDTHTVGLIDKDEALNEAQSRFFEAQKEILESEELDSTQYEKSLEMSSRALTEYVLYRELIIKKLKSITEDNSEADIHDIIAPKYAKFEQSTMIDSIYKNNAWLLDEKFMTFSTILSESQMGEVVSAITLDDEDTAENGRPDISIIFSRNPSGEDKVDVVVVELKKKTNNEKDNSYAINQLLQRAEKLAQHYKKIQRIWYYAILEIDEPFARRLEQLKWIPLFSKSRVYYQEFPTQGPNGTTVPTPMFILPFDAIISDAADRNHTFLTILKEGIKQASANSR